ncbi:MAG: M48 family metalloprotease, partial [Coprobacillus sp.]
MMRIRYKFIEQIIDNLFVSLSINKYPIDIFNVFSSYKNVKVVSYSKHMKKYNLTATEVISHFGSEEGCTIYNENKNKYIVFYNNLEEYYKKTERRLWTLAHELGHILLKHHT